MSYSLCVAGDAIQMKPRGGQWMVEILMLYQRYYSSKYHSLNILYCMQNSVAKMGQSLYTKLVLTLQPF